MSHFYQPDDDTWEGRMDSYIEEAEKQIADLRAALDQERADNERLRAFARDMLGEASPDIGDSLRQFGLTDDNDQPTALLSGRGET